jgi:hypothetical protein
MSWLKSMFSDVNDTVSSKRVITFLAFFLCAAAFVSETWFGTHIDIPVFNSLMYIVIAGLGFTASEKFAPK